MDLIGLWYEFLYLTNIIIWKGSQLASEIFLETEIRTENKITPSEPSEQIQTKWNKINLVKSLKENWIRDNR